MRSLLLRVVMAGLGVLIAGGQVFAQDIIFVNDANKLKDMSALKAPATNEDIPVFKGGDPVYVVMKSGKGLSDVGSAAGQKNGERVIHVIWSFYNQNKEWTDLSSKDVTVPPDQLKNKNFSFTLIPDAYDLNFPGSESFISSPILNQKLKLFFKVRLDSDARPKGFTQDFYTQSGFFIDLTGGLGRCADWKTSYADILKQKEAQKLAEDQKIAEEKALQSQKKAELDRTARTDYILGCKSRRTDPDLESDMKTFLERDGTRTVTAVGLRMPDYEIVRNALGAVLRKTIDTTVLFKLKSNGEYRIRWESYGYEFLGGSVFNEDLNAWVKQHREGFGFYPDTFLMPNQSEISAGRDYTIDDSRIK